MRMLIEAACEPDADGRYHQYLFVTPHDISSIRNLVKAVPEGAMKIIKMGHSKHDAAAGGAGAGAGAGADEDE
jgi:hypothetical protein